MTNYTPTTGALHRPPDPRDYRFRAMSGLLGGTKYLPAKQRNRIAGWAVPPNEQGNVGNCVAQTLRAITMRHEQSERSVDWIYGRMRNRTDTQRGMYVEDALNYLSKLGSIPYDMMPGNTEVPGVIERAYAAAPQLDAIARQQPIEAYVYVCGSNGPVRDDARICDCIDKGYPLLITVYGSDLVYFKTVAGRKVIDLSMSTRQSPDHAIALIGYEVIDGQLYWETFNSWGPHWGEGGIGLLPADYNLFCAYAIVDDLAEVVMPDKEEKPMISTYSLKKDGNTYLSTNFQVKEFRCKDGSDKILIDDALVAMLQRIRDHYGKPVSISSAYRTEAYNKRVGGAAKSQHLYGTAADIRISGVDPRDLARWVETEINPGGLGLYDYAPGDKSGFVHVDTREGRSRWVQTVSNDSSTYKPGLDSIIDDYLDKPAARKVIRLGSTGADVLELERLLVEAGYAPVRSKADAALVAAIEVFQRDKGLSADGVAGGKTWAALTGK